MAIPAPKPQYKRFKPTAKQRGAISPAIRKQLKARSLEICEHCHVALAVHAAHLTRRWKLQSTTVNDLAHLCLECHIWADNTAKGRAWLEWFGNQLRERERTND